MKLPRESTPGHRIGRHNWLDTLPTVRTWIYLLSLLAFAAACAKPTSLGPPFEPISPPPDHLARVYLYRADKPSSLATVRLSIDGRDVGRIRNNEYEALVLQPGSHHLRAGLRGFGLFAWGWNNHPLRLRPGETVYLKISVRLTAQPAPNVRGIEIAGRPSGAASENVFIIRQSADDALSVLRATTRMTRPEPTSDQGRDRD